MTTFEDYKPTSEDLIWAAQMLALVRDGGSLVYPSTQLMYTVSHRNHTLTLMNPDILVKDAHSAKITS
jgi:hypothetical protein